MSSSHHDNEPHLVARIAKDDHVLGSEAAGATLILYADYESAASAEAYSAVGETRRWFGETLKFVFRHFPMQLPGGRALFAAEAAEAAAVQGRFWEMSDLLFRSQHDLSRCGLIGLAEQLGLDLRRFEADIGGRTHHGRVWRDYTGGRQHGVLRPPAFFIGETLYRGAQNADDLVDAIEQAGRNGYAGPGSI